MWRNAPTAKQMCTPNHAGSECDTLKFDKGVAGAKSDNIMSASKEMWGASFRGGRVDEYQNTTTCDMGKGSHAWMDFHELHWRCMVTRGPIPSAMAKKTLYVESTYD